ncbi:intraflagellar transport protein 52 homolog [Trichonephila clavipes]|nr:intraflagellar transport protein 52 homolog [Trichonephila clavipes]
MKSKGVSLKQPVFFRALSFLYPYGATLNVAKPAVAVLSTGSVSFPLNRPVCAFYQHPTSGGKIVVLGSTHMFCDAYIDNEENVKIVNVIFNHLTTSGLLLNAIDADDPEISDYHMIPSIAKLAEHTFSCLQECDEIPSDPSVLFRSSLFQFDNKVLPKVLDAYKELNMKHEPLKLIMPRFETPLAPLQPAQRHHTVLHQFQSSPREIPVSNSNQNLAATSDQNVVQPLATSQEQFCLAGQMNYSNSILLSTAIVRVKNSQGQYVNCRALIDGGSQISLITESCSKYLNLPFYESENTILDLDNKVAAYATKRVELQLSPHFSQVIFAINALIVKEVESIPDASDLSEEDKKVEKFYLDYTRRNRDGRYVVSLPFKNDNALGNSKVQAKRRFFSLENLLQDNPELRDKYVKFMQDYEHLGHMQLVPNSELSKPSSKCFYLPHFGVVRKQSETTKLRIVFDASAKTDSNLSLNDILHTGPKLQNELFNILLKLRCHRIALTGDIEKMFRQILVNEDDVEFQRIFWRERPEEPLTEYRLLTVTYGTACAPYLSIRTVQQLAEEEIKKFLEASKVALEDFYVDDLITGTNSKEDAKKLVSQVIELMKKGGFPIRKWASNESSVLESLPPEL